MWLVCGTGCPPTDKEETGDTDTTPGSGPCDPEDEGTTDAEAAEDAVSADPFGADAGVEATVLAYCAGANTEDGCTELVLDASLSTGGDRWEWWTDAGTTLASEEATFTFIPDGQPVRLAVRDRSGACDGVDVWAQAASYEAGAGAVTPRVIISPVWITASTTRTSGCNFVAGIGGCVVDSLVQGFSAQASAKSVGAAVTLPTFSLDLAAGTGTQGFASWAAWDFLQDDGNARHGQMGTLPAPYATLGGPSTVVVGGNTFTDFVVTGWAVNKGYRVEVTQQKLDDAGVATDMSVTQSSCSSTGKGAVTF